MDRLQREANPPAGQLASPVPQYKDTQTGEWETLKGEAGGSYVKDRDAAAKLEQVRQLLTGIATEETLGELGQLLAGVATEAKLEQARALLSTLAGKDYAQDATLVEVKAELALVKSELAAIKANQLSGDQLVQVSGTIVESPVLQAAAAVLGGGTPYFPTRRMLMTFEIRGTSTSRTIIFEMAPPSQVYEACVCFKVTDPTVMATQTTQGSDVAPSSWQVEIPPGWGFRARISAIAGGEVTVIGKAVLA